MARYLGSISTLTLLRPQFIAATAVVPVPQNGSRIVSPAKENILTSRSASATGKGAGWPLRVDSFLMSVHDERIHVCIFFLFSIERVRWSGVGDRYSPPLRRNRMYSTSFLMIAPG